MRSMEILSRGYPKPTPLGTQLPLCRQREMRAEEMCRRGMRARERYDEEQTGGLSRIPVALLPDRNRRDSEAMQTMPDKRNVMTYFFLKKKKTKVGGKFQGDTRAMSHFPGDLGTHKCNNNLATYPIFPATDILSLTNYCRIRDSSRKFRYP